MEEIVNCSLRVMEEQQSRLDSIRNKKWDGLHQAIESTTRTLKSTTRTLKKVARRSSLLLGGGTKVFEDENTPQGHSDLYRRNPVGVEDANILQAPTA
jgi:hypothetical protein